MRARGRGVGGGPSGSLPVRIESLRSHKQIALLKRGGTKSLWLLDKAICLMIRSSYLMSLTKSR